MEDVSTGAPARRTLLQRGAALLAGVLGLPASAAAAGPEPSDAPKGLRLVGRRRCPSLAAKGTPAAAALAYGELTREVGGPRVGTLHSTALGQPAALHGLPSLAPLELQTFVLKEGTLFGLGTAAVRGGERSCAILGGTGRYAGAQGTYAERPLAGSRRGAVEFVFGLRA